MHVQQELCEVEVLAAIMPLWYTYTFSVDYVYSSVRSIEFKLWNKASHSNHSTVCIHTIQATVVSLASALCYR